MEIGVLVTVGEDGCTYQNPNFHRDPVVFRRWQQRIWI